jgi:hypothetical protein
LFVAEPIQFKFFSIQASFFLFLTTKKRRDIEAKDNSLMKWSTQNQAQAVKNATDTHSDVKRRQNMGAQIAAEQIMEEKCEPRRMSSLHTASMLLNFPLFATFCCCCGGIKLSSTVHP